jgi:FkbM family methyltransferase
MKNKFFIEIGTSDFDTLEPLASNGWSGIFVEPVKELLDNIPKHDNCIYENVAIANYIGTTQIRFYDPEWAEDWVRGVGTIVDRDRNVLNSNTQWKEYERFSDVKVTTLDKLLDKYNVTEIDYLKIDVEGNELIILEDYSWKIKPKLIKFEYFHWGLADDDGGELRNQEVDIMIKKLKEMGYIIYKEECDVYGVL